MGLGGIKKGERAGAEEKAAEEFIQGANQRHNNSPRKKRKKVYKPLTFSLTEEVNQVIDNLTYAPNDFRVNRSEAVKAAIMHLASLTKDEQLTILKQHK